MAWRDNPLGILIDAKMSVDLKKLKEEGLSFVVLEAGLGPDERHPRLSQIVQEAYDNDLPLILMFTTIPDREMITLESNIGDNLRMAQAVTVNHKHYAYMVNVERNWTGYDLEEYQAGQRTYTQIRWSSANNISNVAKGIVDGMKHYFNQIGKPKPVLVRTNDGFVQNSSQPMREWVGLHPFYLADWRYRMPNPDDENRYTKYVSYNVGRIPVETLDALRQQLPPAEAKNPLVPGAATVLRFWEFSGMRFVHPAVKDLHGNTATAKWILFNGNEDALRTFLAFVPKSGEQPGGEDPGTEQPGGEQPGGEQPGEEPQVPVAGDFFRRLESAITAFATAWLNFKADE